MRLSGGRFLRVGQTDETRRHKRVEFPKPVQGVNDGEAFEGVIQDISAGGAAVAVDATDQQLSNFDFIELHIQSMEKKITAQVVRKYEGGIAVKFDVSQQEQDLIQYEIDQYHASGGPKDA